MALTTIAEKLILFLMHVFGVGCTCNGQNHKFLSVYNITLAFFVCSMSVQVYLEKKLLYTGFSIFATCLQFVQYYLIQTHVFYTILQTTVRTEKYQELLCNIEKIGNKFEKKFVSKKALVLLLLTFYSAVAVNALLVQKQFVSWSCWTSLYLTTTISTFYINHLVSLLDFCSSTLNALNSSLEDLVLIPRTLDKIRKCLNSTKSDSKSLRGIFVLQKLVCDLAKSILQTASVSIAVLLLTGCFAYSVLVYKIAMFFISSIQVRRSQWSTWYMIDCQTVVLFAEIYALIRSSESVMTNANRFAVVLHRVRNVYPDFGGNAFNAHSMKLVNQKLRLSLSGVFVLDKELLTGILVSFGTLVVISLQCDEDFLVTNPKTLLLLHVSNDTIYTE